MNIPQLVFIEWLDGQRDWAYVLEIDLYIGAVHIWPTNTTSECVKWVVLKRAPGFMQGTLFDYGGEPVHLTGWSRESGLPRPEPRFEHLLKD